MYTHAHSPHNHEQIHRETHLAERPRREEHPLDRRCRWWSQRKGTQRNRNARCWRGCPGMMRPWSYQGGDVVGVGGMLCTSKTINCLSWKESSLRCVRPKTPEIQTAEALERKWTLGFGGRNACNIIHTFPGPSRSTIPPQESMRADSLQLKTY